MPRPGAGGVGMLKLYKYLFYLALLIMLVPFYRVFVWAKRKVEEIDLEAL